MADQSSASTSGVDKEEDDVKEWISDIKKKVIKIDEEQLSKIKDVKEAFKQARHIEFTIEKKATAFDYGGLYYAMLLYINISLRHKLFKLDNDLYKEEPKRVKYNLEMYEKRFEKTKKGMVLQLKRQRAQEAAEAARAAAAATAAAAKGSEIGSASAVKKTGKTLEEMNAAIDALRISGGGKAHFTSADVGDEADIVTGVVVESDDVPPPKPPKPSLSSESKVSAAGKKLKRVTGDGHCAFRSIAQGIAGGALSFEQETKNAMQLRSLAVSLLKQRSHEEMVGSGLTIEQVVLLKDDLDSFQGYLNKMSKSEYAGETEFWVLADYLQRPIAIFSKGDEEIEHMVTYNPTGPIDKTICLLWQRGAFSEAGNHYDALI